MFLVLCYHSCHNKNKTGVYVLLKKKMWVATNLVFFVCFLFLFFVFAFSFFSIIAMQGTNKNSKCVLYLLYCVSFHNSCYSGLSISFLMKRSMKNNFAFTINNPTSKTDFELRIKGLNLRGEHSRKPLHKYLIRELHYNVKSYPFVYNWV